MGPAWRRAILVHSLIKSAVFVALVLARWLHHLNLSTKPSNATSQLCSLVRIAVEQFLVAHFTLN
jgi:hypothetical protein